ncbi:hypothetical protein K466DRAFT_124704 [Polyporus arcularius HHB13444]|uniref:Uncharacterized protein n=1 Tax=Polyporus arcularius HHB13444 TaxID=1314778 RepID=A0A5C3PBU1_9APHY|nr:hypothetical protein K466DRAFT_124704 [Polyporus arcularius HHB13444]
MQLVLRLVPASRSHASGAPRLARALALDPIMACLSSRPCRAHTWHWHAPSAAFPSAHTTALITTGLQVRAMHVASCEDMHGMRQPHAPARIPEVSHRPSRRPPMVSQFSLRSYSGRVHADGYPRQRRNRVMLRGNPWDWLRCSARIRLPPPSKHETLPCRDAFADGGVTPIADQSMRADISSWNSGSSRACGRLPVCN